MTGIGITATEPAKGNGAGQAAGPRVANRGEIGRFVDALFRYATVGTYVALHSFYHDPKRPPADTRKHRLQSLEGLATAAARRATAVANLSEPTVFAPPTCTFANPSSAAEKNLAEGLTLPVECDARPEAARQLLEGLLGKATLVLASGGVWTDPATGEVRDQLHVHWRLAEPTREPEDHRRLKRARRLAALLAESDTSAVPTVHPLRWPGSWHLKNEPRLARIVDGDPAREIHLEDALDALEVAANMRGVPLDDHPGKKRQNAEVASDADLTALAQTIPNDASTDWAQWNVVGMAFYAASEGSDAGFKAFDEWSAKNRVYDVYTTVARWEHWGDSPPTNLSVGKLVYLARQVDPDFRLPSWDAPPAATAAANAWEAPLLKAIDELNAKHFVVTLGGQTVIATLTKDEVLNREALVFSKKADISLRYEHRHYLVGHTQRGNEIWRSLGDAWLAHRKRRTFERLALLPQGNAAPETYNLWRGFGVKPKAGRWPLIQEYLLAVICVGNRAYCRWLVRWLARAVQHPELHAETAVVLRGKKGAGKGTFGQILQRIFAEHSLQIANPAHLTGRFNAHLVDVLFLFVDEAFWAGDKAGEGTLKGLVTEPTIAIEPKYINLFRVKNRLKILMASNADWVVPTSADERRYFVLDVSECRLGQSAYFTKLHKAIDGPELPAFLDYLLQLDLSNFDHRNPPHTAALNQQKIASADSVIKFWLDCLTNGEIVGNIEVEGEWPEDVVIKVFHDAYVAHAHDHGERHPLSDALLARNIGQLMPDSRLKRTHPRNKPYQENPRPWRYKLPHLEDCREAFAKAMKIDDYQWPKAEDEDE